jgi:hypothetical protein
MKAKQAITNMKAKGQLITLLKRVDIELELQVAIMTTKTREGQEIIAIIFNKETPFNLQTEGKVSLQLIREETCQQCHQHN